MNTNNIQTNYAFSAFHGGTCIAGGDSETVARGLKQRIENDPAAQVIVFDATGRTVEVDLRADTASLVRRLDASVAPPPRQPEMVAKVGPGRPKLGVIAREVTLLPRHWEWLNDQPGGASVALRKVVEAARRANAHSDAKRHSQEAAYRFLNVVAGDLPGFEEATRALFAGDLARFDQHTAAWPPDVRAHGRTLAAVAFGDGDFIGD